MSREPSRQSPPSTRDVSTVVSVLVALPLMVLVAAIFIAALRLNRFAEERAPAIEQVEKSASPAAPAAESSPAASEPAVEKGEKPVASPSVTVTQPPPTGTEAPPAAAAPAPWQAALDQAGDPPSYTKLAFLPFEGAFDRPDRDDLTPWFERTSVAGLRISKIPSPYGKSGTIEGIGRLLCPWPADGVLRLSLDNFNRLKMHFFHGQAGVTLIYYEDQGYRWAAYATTRDEAKPTPKTWAITATDDDRCRRTELRHGGPLELRYRDGELLLSRGDVVLLVAPLAGPPSDVFFEGRATIHGIALARTKDAPSLPFATAAMQDLGRPTELSWTTTNQAAKLERLSDGSLRVTGDKLPERAECFVPLPKAAPQEVILELTDITPGAGVYLGREKGKPAEVVRFLRDRKSGQLAARLCGADDEWQGDFDSPGDNATPLTGSHCWLRLLFGCGNVRWWLSSDGVHWAQTEAARDNAAGGITSVGLQLIANRPEVALTLKRVAIRPLQGLASLAKSDLVKQAPAITSAASLDAWLPEAVKQKPAQVETADWLRASTIATLGGGAPRELAYPLLEALLDDAASRGLAAGQQLAALDDAMLLALDLRDGQSMRTGILSRYGQLGIHAASESVDGGRPWSLVRGHYHAAPAITWMQLPTDLTRAIRWELISDAYRHEPDATLDFVSRLRFFQQQRDAAVSGLSEWVESFVARERTQRGGEAIARLKDSWREPLVEELSKEAYNALTELRAVLESQAWDDAARLVTSLDPESAPGVAPYVSDRSLLTSLPVAVQLTLEDYPQLRQSLGDKFEALAKLRIAQAIHLGNASTIELATVQFTGTPAAADAHRWLGDQALVAGHFARAVRQYERARDSAPAANNEISPRIRLAAAMLGQDAEKPVRKAVQFGDVSMSPAEFESLVAEMRARESSSPEQRQSESTPPVPSPGGFKPHVRSRLDGPVGERPQEEVGRRTNALRVPWADRQLATAVAGDLMYVANHFQVAAYKLTTGERIWQSQTPPGQPQRAQEFAMIPMRPVVAGERIFVRLLYSPNPQLVCFERSSGKLLWTAESHDREFLVSDPLLIEGQLVALSIAIQPDQQGLLRFCTFDPQTGERIRQRDLVQLRNTWGTRACCELVKLDDGLAVALGGVTLAVDAAGQLRWVRTHVTLPAEEDPRWVMQTYQPPFLKNGRLYLAQPGVRTVECLAAATGRRYWSAVLPEVVGIVGLAGDKLIVRTESDLRGLDLASGAAQWRYPADHLFPFQLVDNERLLIASRERTPSDADQSRVRLTWINPLDGKAIASAVLEGLVESDPRLGPLVPYKDRLFTFFGRGQHDPTRDIVELAPAGEAEPAIPKADAWHARLQAARR